MSKDVKLDATLNGYLGFHVFAVTDGMLLHKIFVSLTSHAAVVDRCPTTSKIDVLLLCLVQAWVKYELDENQRTFCFQKKYE